MRQIPLLFGRFMVKTGWVSESQLQHAVQLQRELTVSPGLMALLDDLITPDQLRQILEHQRQTGRLFHAAVCELGLLDEAQLTALYTRCQDARVPLGEALLLQGSLSDTTLRDALRAFKQYQTSGVLCGPEDGADTAVSSPPEAET